LFPFLCSIDHHPDNILFLCLFLLWETQVSCFIPIDR
jgi:hypothetical protein